jgi:hypothetical protein
MKLRYLVAASLIFLGVGCTNNTTLSGSGETVSFDERAKCEELASKFRKEREDAKPLVGTYIQPVYGYSRKYNTCVYSGGVMQNNGKEDWTEYYIIDLLTNTIISSFDTNPSMSSSNDSGYYQKVESLKKELSDQSATRTN